MTRYRLTLKERLESMLSGPPVIHTPYGTVTEVARKQAAINMSADPKLFAKVLAILVRECGGDEARGLAEMKRRYPEAF